MTSKLADQLFARLMFSSIDVSSIDVFLLRTMCD